MNNIFGTDGIRGEVGKGYFVTEKLQALGNALGLWALTKYTHPRILFCHDTRESATSIMQSLFTGIAHHNIKASNAGILPTPAACALLQYGQNFDIAVVISASHNPFQDNGIKIFDKSSMRITSKDEENITAMLNDKKSGYSSTPTALSEYTCADQEYLEILCESFRPNFLHGISVILDTANGATSYLAPHVFSHFGAHVISIHNKPNGININENCGSTNIEILQQTMKKEQAHIGFAFDGDGDRLIIVNKHGEMKDGDDILSFLSKYSEYNKDLTVVGTVMSNQGLDKHLAGQNKQLVRAQVGEKNVYHELEKRNMTLGGENCGHIILKNHLPSGDGIYVALKIAEACCRLNTWEIETFEKFPQVMINVPISQRKDLTISPLVHYINEAEDMLVEGRLLVRYSGTQNILRVMVEEQNENLAQKIAQTLAQNLQKELNP